MISARFKPQREHYIPKEATILQQDDNGIVYGYISGKGKSAAIAFKGKAQNPAWHYTFVTPDHRQTYINEWFKNLKAHEEFKADYRKRKQEAAANHTIKQGDYFYTSWGYDQTNIDYLIVVSVTNKTAVCKMVNAILVDSEAQQDVLIPGDASGDTFRMKIDGQTTLCGSYPYCGNSSKRFGYFSKTSLTEVHRQTNPMFGH
jgi:hypothetical protein